MFAPDSRVTVHPYSVQRDGDEYVLGWAGGGYIALPGEALEILEDLVAGRTPAEVQELYHARHGERPDIDDFLAELGHRGFIAPAGTGDGAPGPGAASAPIDHQVAAPREAAIFPALARLLFSRWALAAYLVVVFAAAAAAAMAPEIVPGRRMLLFAHHRSLNISLLMLFTLFSIWLHEMGHIMAARAAGVRGRLGIGHRLWVLVAETDLSGLWALPKRQRYLPFLAGGIVDLVSASLLLLALFAGTRHWISLPDAAAQLLGAAIFVSFMRLLWQAFFFVRTDLYYVIAGLAGCKNLMSDTEAFLRNQLARVLPRIRRIDQSAIQRRELRVIQLYSIVWMAGRLAATGLLLFVTLPVALYYCITLATSFRDVAVHPLAFFDALCIAAAFLVPLLAGLALWVRSLIRLRRTP
jgi:hypothetical protein